MIATITHLETNNTLTGGVLAEVLFASPLQASDHPTPDQVRAAITGQLGRTDVNACAACVAQEAGDHPDTFLTRMRWALTEVRTAYRRTAGVTGGCSRGDHGGAEPSPDPAPEPR